MTRNQSDEIVDPINNDLVKAINAVATVRRPKTRRNSFLLSKNLENVRRNNVRSFIKQLSHVAHRRSLKSTDKQRKFCMANADLRSGPSNHNPDLECL